VCAVSVRGTMGARATAPPVVSADIPAG
jgi:hypothetical protein